MSSAKLARPPHQRGEVVDRRTRRARDVGDDLLGEHVERVAQEAGVLDLSPSLIRRATTAASSRSPRCLGKIVPAARLADRVAGAADALQPARHRARRLDLDHEVDRAHVDAELERAGGDDAAQLAALQLVLDDEPLLAGQRAVVGLDELAGLADAPTGSSVSASSLSRAASRSAWRRALQKMIVVRWASTSSSSRG